MNLSVVIPAYNEERDIKGAIGDVITSYPEAEIIVVNDASTDRTLEILVELQRELPELKVISNTVNQGHGFSVIRGLKQAQGNYIMYIDADRQINIRVALEGGFDFASGWRVNRSDKPFRKFVSLCLKLTNLIWHGMYIKDANCPFKVYKRESLLPLLEKLPTSYIVPIACLEVLARKSRLITVTIPTPHHPYDGVRKGFLQILNVSALKFFRDAFFEVVSL